MSLEGWHEDRVVPRLVQRRRHEHLSTFGFRGFEVATEGTNHLKNATNTIDTIALFAPAVAGHCCRKTM
jgi:hypothetical protein